jgi:hypothetical protein
MRKDHPLDVNTVEAIGVPDAENTLDEYIRVGGTRHQSAEKTRGRLSGGKVRFENRSELEPDLNRTCVRRSGSANT